MELLDKAFNQWEALGEVYYRKYNLSKMITILPKIDFSWCHIAVAKNGGLMAFVKKSKQVIMDSSNPLKDSIRIFYQDGKYLGILRFGENEKSIVFFDFTKDETLIAIMDDGKIYKFDIFTRTFTYKIAGLEFSNNRIVSARFFQEGFVCLTQNNNFYIIPDLKEPVSSLYFNLSILFGDEIPRDYLFISASDSLSEKIELLVPHPKHGLLRIINGKEKQFIKNSTPTSYSKANVDENFTSDDLGKITNLVMSPNKQYLAVFNENGNLFVFPVKFKFDEEEQRRKSSTKLSLNGNYQILWCAEDCVLIVNRGSVFLIGPDDNLLKIDIIKKHIRNNNNNINLYAVEEIDGVRLIYDDGVDFIQRVSEDLHNSLSSFQSDPAKILLDAYLKLEEKIPNCDEDIRKIRHSLPEAVEKLLNSATSQWEIPCQLYLLKAAQHGKTFLTKNEFNFNKFVSVARDLRILNNLRSYDNPRLITYTQYQEMQPKALINALIKTQNFYLANEISVYLNMKVRKVYQKWAVAKVKNLPNGLSQAEEVDYYNDIQKKLSEISGISYIKLAKKAFKFRKEEIGIKFLENEKSILTKIPQYIELKRWDKALELSFETYDSNVIYTVVDKIMTEESVDTFKSIVSKYKKADLVVFEYLKKNHNELLKEYLEEKKNFEALFFYSLENFFKEISVERRRSLVRDCKNCIRNLEGSKEFDYKFYKTYIEDIEKSLLLKRDLIKDNFIKQSDITSVDNSIMDCYRTLIKQEKMPLVEKLNSNFEISQKKLLVLRLKCYAEMNQPEAIKILASNVKTNHLSYINIAEICMDHKLTDIAVENIKKINNEELFEYKIGMLKHMEKYAEALEAIISNKNCDKKREYIEDILSKVPELKYKVDELIVKYKVNL